MQTGEWGRGCISAGEQGGQDPLPSLRRPWGKSPSKKPEAGEQKEQKLEGRSELKMEIREGERRGGRGAQHRGRSRDNRVGSHLERTGARRVKHFSGRDPVLLEVPDLMGPLSYLPLSSWANAGSCIRQLTYACVCCLKTSVSNSWKLNSGCRTIL